MKRILVSRTDSLGDVMLTLPLTGYLKQQFPDSEIYFLGKNYTRPLIECSTYIDHFVSWDLLGSEDFDKQVAVIKAFNLDVVIHVFPNKEFAKVAYAAKIPMRIGTSHRPYHWLTCNKLVHFSRKNSTLHESQLNFQLLKPLVAEVTYNLDKMQQLSGFEINKDHHEVDLFIDKNKKNIILHSKSKGSAREWGLANFAQLISLLPSEKYNIILTGTEDEGKQFRSTLAEPFLNAVDVSGKLSLIQLIALIAKADFLVACSTGPLHIASALGINTIGIYPPIKPMHPGRWAPIGYKSKVFVKEAECNKCSKGGECTCMTEIKASDVAEYINSCCN
jgi:ADP-heptose:LPS heptosyltransferase